VDGIVILTERFSPTEDNQTQEDVLKFLQTFAIETKHYVVQMAVHYRR
jgi:hypothetical protein